MTTKKILQRHVHVQQYATRVHPMRRGALVADVDLMLDDSPKHLSLVVSGEEVDLLRDACTYSLNMKLTVTLEVEESTIRERIGRLEDELRALKLMVTP